MTRDLQKASLFKRIFAGLFDGMLVVILAIAVAMVLSVALNYDGKTQQMNDIYNRYEEQFQTSLDYTMEQYDALSEQEQQRFMDAYDALNADEEALALYNSVIQLMLLMVSAGLLAGVALVELVVPLAMGDGKTLGKKIFGLCLMRTDGVRVSKLQVFVRAVLGKYTVETMIPVFIILRFLWGTVDMISIAILMGILIAQVILLFGSRTNALIHDQMAGTVVVDYNSQQIFNSPEELLEHQKREAAERAAREIY